jgi:hypothetical protein
MARLQTLRYFSDGAGGSRSWGSPTEFGRVFHADFESYAIGGNLPVSPASPWVRDGDRGLPIIVSSCLDGYPLRAGSTRCIRSNWDGTVAWDSAQSFLPFVLPSWAYNREFFMRVWLRADSDVDVQDGCKLFRWDFGGTKEGYYNPLFEGAGSFVYPIEGRPSNDASLPANYLQQGSPAITDRAGWVCWEWYVRNSSNSSTPDGAFKIWESGTLIYNRDNVITHTDSDNWYPLNVMSNWSSNPGWEHDANNHMYFDEFEIFSDTGTGGTGSMFDGTAGV